MELKRYISILVVLSLIGMSLSVVLIPMEEVKASDSWEDEYHNDTPTNYTKVFLNGDEDNSDLNSHIGTGTQITGIYNIEFAPQTIQDFTNPINGDKEWHDFADVNLGVRIGNWIMNDMNYGRSLSITFFYHISDENSDHPRDLESLATRMIADIDDSDSPAGFEHVKTGNGWYIGGTNVEQLKSNIDLKEIYSDMAKDTFENVITTVSPAAGILAHTRDMISYLDPDQYAAYYDTSGRTGYIDRMSDQAPVLDYDSDTGFDEGFRYMDFYETYTLNIPEDEEEFSISISLSDADSGGYGPWANQRSYGSYTIDFDVSDCYGCLDGSCDCDDGGGGGGGSGGNPDPPPNLPWGDDTWFEEK